MKLNNGSTLNVSGDCGYERSIRCIKEERGRDKEVN